MNVRKMPLEELELLSYADIAYELLKTDKKTKTTPALFTEVCKLLNISEDAMFEMIGDFYTTLTTDKRFLLLDNAEWDLKEFHAVKPVLDEDDEEESEEDDTVQENEEESSDDSLDDNVDDDSYDNDDSGDLEDLVVVTEEEMEE